MERNGEEEFTKGGAHNKTFPQMITKIGRKCVDVKLNGTFS